MEAEGLVVIWFIGLAACAFLALLALELVLDAISDAIGERRQRLLVSWAARIAPFATFAAVFGYQLGQKSDPVTAVIIGIIAALFIWGSTKLLRSVLVAEPAPDTDTSGDQESL
jgi:hypothetical protein